MVLVCGVGVCGVGAGPLFFLIGTGLLFLQLLRDLDFGAGLLFHGVFGGGLWCRATFPATFKE